MGRIRSEDGTTLIEVLISMVIVAIAAMGGIAQYHNANEIKTIAAHKKIASEMANSKLEELRSLPYAHADLNVGTTMSNVTVGNIAANVSDGLGQTVVVTDTGGGYKQIQVDIDWKEVGMTDRVFNVSLNTYKRQ